MPGIYLRDGSRYVATTETPYGAECDLQALIGRHPEMLAEPGTGHGPLVLVRREAAVTDHEEAGGRWSLDHLYVDGEGVPTLVEVKRSSDTRGRREVVAQMLDYAANAKTSFSADRMAAWLDERARATGSSAAEVLAESFGVDDPDEFWQGVATNLDAERFRLIFVSDVIPSELRRIIKFLNGQMARTDVLAIEVKQYVDGAGQHQTIVPRVIGDTEVARTTKRGATRATRNDRSTLLAALRGEHPDAVVAAERLLAWADADPSLEVRWSSAGDIAMATGGDPLLRIRAEGTVEVKVNSLRRLDSGWDDDDRIEALLVRLEQIDGVALTGNRRRWPRTPLAPLADPSRRQTFTEMILEAVSAADTAGPASGA